MTRRPTADAAATGTNTATASSTTAAVLKRRLGSSPLLLLLTGEAVVHEVAVVLQHVLQVGVGGQVLHSTRSKNNKLSLWWVILGDVVAQFRRCGGSLGDVVAVW